MTTTKTARSENKIINCPNCKTKIPPDSKFCNHCGTPQTKIADNVAPAAAIAQPPVEHHNAPAAPQDSAPVNQAPPVVPQPQYQVCPTCDGGSRFENNRLVCPTCRAIKPLAPGYTIDPSMFQWAQDGAAMAKLRSIGPLNAMAKKLSDRVGRKWIEASFNGVRLSERQMPKVYGAAVRAARILGLKQMPDVYVSGERPWNSNTFGSNESAFVVMGAALVSSFRGADLMFLFAREMGHILCGHALWKTVIRFLVGEHTTKAGLMKHGVTGLIDPGKWIEGAIEVPLLSWARQSEITADRAGMLAIGRLETVRRTLLSWTLKSPFLYKQINVKEWLKQREDDAIDESVRLSELVTSATPYITRRLKLIAEFERDPLIPQFKQYIAPILKKDIENMKQQAQANSEKASLPFAEKPPAEVEFNCPECESTMKVARSAFKENKPLAVRCPNPDCGVVNMIKPKTRREEKLDAIEQQNLQSAN